MVMVLAWIIRIVWALGAFAQCRFGLGFSAESEYLLHYLLGSGQEKTIPTEWWEDIKQAYGACDMETLHVDEDGDESVLIQNYDFQADGENVGKSLLDGHPLARIVGSFWLWRSSDYQEWWFEDRYDWHQGEDREELPLWDTSALPLEGYYTFNLPSGWMFRVLGWFHALLGVAYWDPDLKTWAVSEGIFALAELAGAKPFMTKGYLAE